MVAEERVSRLTLDVTQGGWLRCPESLIAIGAITNGVKQPLSADRSVINLLCSHSRGDEQNVGLHRAVIAGSSAVGQSRSAPGRVKNRVRCIPRELPRVNCCAKTT